MVKFGLSSKKVMAATLLAFGESHKKAAETADVTPGTISVWKQDSEFMAKIHEIQLDTMLDTQSKFRSLAFTATEILEKLLQDSKSEKVKLEAAKYILSTIQLAPSDGAFWMVGPTTAEEVESKEHAKAIQKRLKEIQDEIKLPIF